MTNEKQMDRAVGTMLGQVAGDSFGSMFEFKTGASIACLLPDGLPRNIHGSPVWNTIAGQATDDSEMAIAMARSVVKQKGFDSEDIKLAYIRWYESHPFDCGGTTSAALSGYLSDKDRRNFNSQANGGLMRVSPLGIYGWNKDPKFLMDIAAADCELTHPNDVCVAASMVFAATIAHAIRSRELPLQIYTFARDFASFCGDASVTLAITDAEADVRYTTDDTKLGWVLTALNNAFYQLLHATSPCAGIRDVVSYGGDTDTNGAITGALLGAVYGAMAFPARWKKTIATCMPNKETSRPRPTEYWPNDYKYIARKLFAAGA